MSQKPLSEAGGEAQFVGVKFPHEQVVKIIKLAGSDRGALSAFIRKAVADAIEAAELQAAS
jgi:hypothetical protein